MKKVILIMLLLMTKNIMAEDYYAKISLGQQDGKDGQQDATGGGFVLGMKLNSNFLTEINVDHKQKDNKGFGTRIDLGIIGKVKLLDNLELDTNNPIKKEHCGTERFDYKDTLEKNYNDNILNLININEIDILKNIN